MKPNKKQIYTFTLTPEEHETLRDVSIKLKRSMSSALGFMVDYWAKKLKREKP